MPLRLRQSGAGRSEKKVLDTLSASGVAFDAVPDLCEMSARRDPALQELAQGGALKIAACYPRAVTWLFSAADAPLPEEGVEILNMRVESAETVIAALLPDEAETHQFYECSFYCFNQTTTARSALRRQRQHMRLLPQNARRFCVRFWKKATLFRRSQRRRRASAIGNGALAGAGPLSRRKTGAGLGR